VDKSTDGAAKRTPLSWSRAGVVILALVSLGTGYVGLYTYQPPPPNAPVGYWLDLFYYDLQLFVIDSAPLADGGPFPLALEFARILAPVTTVYAVVVAFLGLLRAEFRRIRLRRSRNHAIVTGDTTGARALATRLRQTGVSVVETADSDAIALVAAGIGGARTLYACADDTTNATVNLAAALDATEAKRRGRAKRGLRIYAQVSDATLALALRARRLGLPEATALDVDFVNFEELAARELLRSEPLDIDLSDPPHILVAGLGTFGRTVLVEFAQQWRLRSPRRGERVAVTLVDPAASGAAAELAARSDIVREVFDLTPVDGDLDDALRTLSGPPPYRAYICYEDEDLALRQAFTMVGLWRGGRDSIVLRLNQLDRPGDAVHPVFRRLLDNLYGRLRFVGVAKLACDPSVIEKDLVERLAQAIHEQYLLEALRDGAAMGSNVSMTLWGDLPEDKKDANRAQAGDIGVKLSMVGCTVAPRTGAGDAFSFTPAEIESLAQHEQQRWRTERQASGWKYAAVRDDKAKKHPSIVSWETLPETERDKDRNAVRTLPAVLAHVGLRIVRVGERRAQEIGVELTSPASV